MLDYKKLLESLLRELIDKKIISEWYCNGAGYFWKYNEKDKRIIKLEKENAELRNNGFTVSAMTEQQLKVALEKGEQLEKENTELKEELKDANEKVVHLACNQNKDLKYKLTKAKEIIKELYEGLDKLYLSGLSAKQIAFIERLQDKTEQFLKEIEK